MLAAASNAVRKIRHGHFLGVGEVMLIVRGVWILVGLPLAGRPFV
jgi:hypothetical protein